jgi:hypothetical protein
MFEEALEGDSKLFSVKETKFFFSSSFFLTGRLGASAGATGLIFFVSTIFFFFFVAENKILLGKRKEIVFVFGSEIFSRQ